MLLHQQWCIPHPKRETAMTRSFNTLRIGRVVTAVVLAGAASALTLGGALLAVIS